MNGCSAFRINPENKHTSNICFTNSNISTWKNQCTDQFFWGCPPVFICHTCIHAPSHTQNAANTHTYLFYSSRTAFNCIPLDLAYRHNVGIHRSKRTRTVHATAHILMIGISETQLPCVHLSWIACVCVSKTVGAELLVLKLTWDYGQMDGNKLTKTEVRRSQVSIEACLLTTVPLPYTLTTIRMHKSHVQGQNSMWRLEFYTVQFCSMQYFVT